MKPTPASLISRVMSPGGTSSLTPSAASTSEAPEIEDTERLPCLAILTPAPAATSDAQVETLNVPWPSPPVPTMSTAPAGASTRVIFSRISLAAPVISSTVSPRTRSAIRNAPICAGVATPDIMISSADCISSTDSVAPVATLPMIVFKRVRGHRFPRAVAQAADLAELRRRGAMPASSRKLASSSWPCSEAMLSGWNCTPCTGCVLCCRPMMMPSVGLGRDLEGGRQARALDDQRVIARHLELVGQALEQPCAAIADRRQLAVHRLGRADHLAAVDLADRLVAEADAEQRDRRPGLGDQVEADAGLVGRARPRRQHDRLRLHADRRVDGDLVVAEDLARRTELAQEVDEVIGEAVVVIDQEQHGGLVRFSGGRCGR